MFSHRQLDFITGATVMQKVIKKVNLLLVEEIFSRSFDQSFHYHSSSDRR